MTARRIEEAERRLHELRTEEWSDLTLAALAMGLALGATAVHPPLAGPLFIGALVVGFLAARAFFRRSELFDRLLLDRDAYAIPQIRRRAEDIASMEGRLTLAVSVRNRLTPVPGYELAPRVVAVAEELGVVASQLEDEELELDPACAVRCRQLLTNSVDSPLLNDLLPENDVHVWIRQISAGFEQRQA